MSPRPNMSSEARNQPVATTLLVDGLQKLALGGALEPERLLAFVQLLLDWNRVYNLTSVRRPAEVVKRHILDSLVVAPHVEGQRVLDVGTGAGLPGIPLAMALPDKEFVLLDSSSKKVRFVQQAITALSLDNVRTEHVRVENYRPAELFDTVLCRAFTNLQEFYLQARGACAPDGCLLAMKGVYPMAEIESFEQAGALLDVIKLNVPGLDAERHLVYMRNTSV